LASIHLASGIYLRHRRRGSLNRTKVIPRNVPPVQALPQSIQREVLTPTGMQPVAELTRRRRIVVALNIVTYCALALAFGLDSPAMAAGASSMC
jgi:hypothetical protein